MAQRRMFSSEIVNSDAFLDMPISSQALYFQLGMRADDDGFVNPRSIMRLVSATEDDLKLLIAKKFIIPFENGVIVIKHWRINNFVRKDRYHETLYLQQKEKLYVKPNQAYSLNNGDGALPIAEVPWKSDTKEDGQPKVNHRSTQDRIGKDSIKDFTNVKSIPLTIERDEEKKGRVPPDKKALTLRDWCYERIEEEFGQKPTTNMGDYIQLSKALKSLTEKDVKLMMEDAIENGKGQTVRSVFTDREIDIYRQENL